MAQISTSDLTFESLCFYTTYILLGIVPLFFNTLVLTVITRIKKLRNNRWLMLIVALILSDTSLSTGYVIKSVITIEQLLNVDNRSIAINKYSSSQCVGWSIPIVFGYISNQLLTLSIAVDRAIAITKPNYYRLNADRIVKGIMLISAFFALSFVISSFLGIPQNDVVYFCTFTTGLLPNFKTAFYGTAHVTSMALVSVYIYLLFITRLRIRLLRKQQQTGDLTSDKSNDLERQILVAKKISPLIIVYCITSLPGFSGLDILPRILVYITTTSNITRSLMASQLLISINTCINSALYTWTNDEIRDKLKMGLLRIKNWFRFRNKVNDPITWTVPSTFS